MDNINPSTSTYPASIYTDPVIGHHLSSQRDHCHDSLVVREAVENALSKRAFNQPFSPPFSRIFKPMERHRLRKLYELAYTVALDYNPEKSEAAYRRGYEDWLVGSEPIENSKSYLGGYRQAQEDDDDYQRGQEEIYWGDREYAW